jgi:hypothetical protein
MKFNQIDQPSKEGQVQKKGLEALNSIFNFNQLVEGP